MVMGNCIATSHRLPIGQAQVGVQRITWPFEPICKLILMCSSGLLLFLGMELGGPPKF